MAYASRKAVVGRGIDTLKSAKGEKTADIDELNMDDEYEAKVPK
jgi:twitching motility protein PilT